MLTVSNCWSNTTANRPTSEIIERDDSYIDTGSIPNDISPILISGRQPKEMRLNSRKEEFWRLAAERGDTQFIYNKKDSKVTGIDNSPGAVKVCKLRGLE